tara:strand:- start:206 stop:388 length:183 start_codon:yes stop_codon:yes gene_type:complete
VKCDRNTSSEKEENTQVYEMNNNNQRFIVSFSTFMHEINRKIEIKEMVGLEGLEPPTKRL